MNKSLLFFFPVIFCLNITNVSALEIDEKLTLRFLKVSETKKTVLINRGGEDGLVVGDHAKFFITAGVVARGVVEKVSPSRSVWSLYRIVDPNEITQDKVLNLKIASPVKITDDPSRSLKEEVIPGGSDKLDIEPGAGGDESTDNTVNDADKVGNKDSIKDADKDEMSELGMNEDGGGDEVDSLKVKPKTGNKSRSKIASGKMNSAKPTTTSEDTPEEYSPNNNSKTWEVWGTLALNSLTGTVDSGGTTNGGTSTGASNSSIDLSLGIEKYFLKYNNFLKEFSVGVALHKVGVESGDQVKSKTDLFEYGANANYHFYNSAASINKLVGFATGTLGKGTSTVASTSVVSGVATTTSVKGTTSFVSGGIGAKYILTNGFGVRAVFDYYKTTETYSFEDGTTVRTLSGPRVQFGLSYRF
jgi:hypothetical protein